MDATTAAAAVEDAAEDASVINIRVLEFFSGIGGMRVSLEKALERLNHHPSGSGSRKRKRYVLERCRAYDISLHANNVYRHNFDHGNNTSSSSVCTKLVEHLAPNDVAPFRANLWTLSPPCQPFTTNGKHKERLDSEDNRCNGLKGLLRLLTKLAPDQKPKWILLENVKGFATSHMCQRMLKVLTTNGYSYRSVLLSPVDLGIPNHRKRFYLLAERNSKRWPLALDGDEIAPTGLESLTNHEAIVERPVYTVGRYLDENLPSEPATSDNEASNPYLVPDTVLAKAWSKGLGVVSATDTATHCVTAGYGRIYHPSTGSLLLVPNSPADVARNRASLKDLPLDRSDMGIYSRQLRRFSPEELLRLLGFVEVVDANVHGEPTESEEDKRENGVGGGDGAREAEDGSVGDADNTPQTTRRPFEIPASVVPSLEQRYKLIGNSISVDVVTELLCELLQSA